MQQALHAAAQIDKRAERAHRRDAAGHDGAGDDRSPCLCGAFPLGLLEQRAPRDDEVLAAFRVLDDPEFVDASEVRRRLRSGGVDLRERAERALTRDPHFVTALDLPLDLPFDRETGAERALELPLGCGSPHQLAGKGQSTRRRHHRRLNAIAHRDLEIAVVVFQLGDLDRGFALAADVDERSLGPNRDDRALECLPRLEPLRLDGRLEHRRKVFLGLIHDALPTVRLKADTTETRSVISTEAEGNYTGRMARRLRSGASQAS